MAKRYTSPVKDYSDELVGWLGLGCTACGCTMLAIIVWLVFVWSTVYVFSHTL